MTNLANVSDKNISPCGKWRAYLSLMRLDKPVGIWLVFYPAGWAVALASPGAPDASLLLLLLLGAILMRSAGCILNDLADATLDANVARTMLRPLACGALKKHQALTLLGALLLAAFALLFFLPHNPILLALLVLPAVVLYPFMKRITFWPQAFLGLTFNTSALFGWYEATGGHLSIEAFILYAGCCFWTLGYDTIYALQDIEDDTKIGIKSTARKMGKNAHWLIALSYSMMLGCFIWLAITLAVGDAMLFGIVFMAAHLAWQWWMVKLHQAHYAKRLFLSNAMLGLVVFCTLMLDRYDTSILWR
jgi:4-hydroxybenzoate polyprenyltransferase